MFKELVDKARLKAHPPLTQTEICVIIYPHLDKEHFRNERDKFYKYYKGRHNAPPELFEILHSIIDGELRLVGENRSKRGPATRIYEVV